MTQHSSRIPPKTAMLLAAGLGTRMRPVTLTKPKPMIEVAGKALIDWALDAASAAGVTRAAVNVHYLADHIVAHMRDRRTPAITISDETERLLDTGGGIVKALPLLGNKPFVVMNTDAILTDNTQPALSRLFARWADDVDCVMLVHPRETAHGFDGAGDFFVFPDGAMQRRGNAPRAPFVYAGAYVLDPVVLKDVPDGAFSANVVWDRLIAADRMRAVVHDGDWFHVGTPDAIAPTTAALTKLGLGK